MVRMNEALVAFLWEVSLVHLLDYLSVDISPFLCPFYGHHRVRCPPRHPERASGKRTCLFSSRLLRVCLGCKDSTLHRVQSLQRQAFMYLNDPAQVFFKGEYEKGFMALAAWNASSVMNTHPWFLKNCLYDSSTRDAKAGSEHWAARGNATNAPKPGIMNNDWTEKTVRCSTGALIILRNSLWKDRRRRGEWPSRGWKCSRAESNSVNAEEMLVDDSLWQLSGVTGW